MVKNLLANAGDEGSSPGSRGSPREGNGNPIQHYCPVTEGSNHRQRSLAGKSPWGHKDLDMIEQLTLSHIFPKTTSILPLTLPQLLHWKCSFQHHQINSLLVNSLINSQSLICLFLSFVNLFFILSGSSIRHNWFLTSWYTFFPLIPRHMFLWISILGPLILSNLKSIFECLIHSLP